APGIAAGSGLITGRARDCVVTVRGHFSGQQGDVLLAAKFAQVAKAQPRALALLHGRGSLKVGQGKVALAVAAVGGAKQGKQSGLLADGQQLAVTERPPLGGEVPGKDSDFRYELV